MDERGTLFSALEERRTSCGTTGASSKTLHTIGLDRIRNQGSGSTPYLSGFGSQGNAASDVVCLRRRERKTAKFHPLGPWLCVVEWLTSGVDQS